MRRKKANPMDQAVKIMWRKNDLDEAKALAEERDLEFSEFVRDAVMIQVAAARVKKAEAVVERSF